MKEIFREYDIRGIINESFTEETIKKIGYHLGLKIKEKNLKNIAVGHDARTHGKDVFHWLISGLNKAGLKVIYLGEIATPTAYFSGFQKHKGEAIDSNIMITGSHLPAQYNGLKITIQNKSFFGEDIYKLGDEVMESKEIIEDDHNYEDSNIREEYTQYLINEFQDLKNLDREIIIDTGNGVGGPFVREIITALGLNAKILFEKPDGTFPNHVADPSIPENIVDLQKELSQNPDAIGLALDGDCDRIFVLEDNEIIHHDMLAVSFAKRIENPKVVGEVRCSKTMYDEINKYGTAVMWKAGHSNIKEKIREIDAHFGIELSGHVFFNDKYFGYDDGIYGMLRILELYLKENKLKEDTKHMPKIYVSPQIRIEVPENIKFQKSDEIIQYIKDNLNSLPDAKSFIDIDGIRVEFETGWALVRPSNTSPYLVTRFESSNEENLETIKNSIFEIIDKIIPNNVKKN